MFKVRGKFQFVSLLLVIFCSGSVNAETGKVPDPKAVVLSKKLHEKHCQVCHQKDGVGENPIPWSIRNPDYLTAMALNETSHAWHHSDEELVKMVLEGLRRTNRMPAWKSVLSEKEA